MAYYNIKTIQDVVAKARKADNLVNFSKKTGIPRSTLRDWLIKYPEGYDFSKDVFVEKEKQKEEKKVIKTQTLMEILGNKLCEAAEKLKPISAPPKLKKHNKREPEECFIVLSDIQIGEIVNKIKTGGLGSYDKTVFLDRMGNFKNGINSILDIFQNVIPIHRVNVLILGDIIEGKTIFKGQQGKVDTDVAFQIMNGVDEISIFLSWLATRVSEVHAYCVAGNHGRIGQKGELEPVHDNLEYVLYHWMKDRLSCHKNISINISDTWWMCIERMGHRFYITHGDDIKSWMNIPFYGAQRSAGRVQRLVRHDWFIVGHHHTQAQFDNVLMNGSWVGGSEFSLKAMQVGGLPTQLMFMLHPKKGITCKYDIQLASPEEFEPVIFN